MMELREIMAEKTNMTNPEITSQIAGKRSAISKLEMEIQGIRVEIELLKRQMGCPYAPGDILTFEEVWGYGSTKQLQQRRIRLREVYMSDEGELTSAYGTRIKKDGSDGKPEKVYNYQLDKVIAHEKAESK